MKCFIFAVIIFITNSVYAVDFSWEANTEVDLAGYRLYGSNESGVYQIGKGEELVEVLTGTELVTVETDLEYFVLTAFDKSGNESKPSIEVNRTPDIPKVFKIIIMIIFEGE